MLHAFLCPERLPWLPSMEALSQTNSAPEEIHLNDSSYQTRGQKVTETMWELNQVVLRFAAVNVAGDVT